MSITWRADLGIVATLGGATTVTGKTTGENLDGIGIQDPDVIRPCKSPLKEDTDFLALRGNLFDVGCEDHGVI